MDPKKENNGTLVAPLNIDSQRQNVSIIYNPSLLELYKSEEITALPGNTLSAVRHGSSKKGPALSWGQYNGVFFDKTDTRFKSWKPFEDKQRSTLIITGELLKTKGNYLRVIDLDPPKKAGDIDLNVLLDLFSDEINSTRTHITPSGGRHIFIIDESESKETEATLGISNINIDYQNQNKLVNIGFYYQRDKETGECIKKEYTKVDESPIGIKKISDLGFNSVDELLKTKIKELKSLIKKEQPNLKDNNNKSSKKAHNGIYGTYDLSQESKDKLAAILKQFVQHGSRQDFALYISGYLIKIGFKKDVIIDLLGIIFVNDIEERLNTVETTIKQSSDLIKGWSGIYEIIKAQGKTKHETLGIMNELEDILIPPGSEFQKNKIISLLNQSKENSTVRRLITIYLAHKYYIVKNYRTGLLYIFEDETKSFKLITEKDLHKLTAKEFGNFQINIRLIREIEGQFSNYREPEYNIIQFRNKNLDIITGEVFDKPETPEKAPFSIYSVDYDWNPEAQGGLMEKTIKEILGYDKNQQNYLVFLQVVGYLFEPGNRLEKYLEIVGKPGSGKSLLGEIIKHIFPDYSEVPLADIATNEGSTTEALLGSRVNIIDDSDTGVIKNLGPLKSFTSTSSYTVNPKYKSKVVIPPDEKPKIVVLGNKLSYYVDPSKAMYERILFIQTPNKFRGTEDENKNLKNQIIDNPENMEWLISTAIMEYQKIREKGDFSLVDDAKEIERKHNLESYPHQVAAETLFEWDVNGEIEQKEAHDLILNQLNEWREKGEISSKIDLKPSSFKTAIQNVGGYLWRVRNEYNKLIPVYRGINLVASEDNGSPEYKKLDIINITPKGRKLYDCGKLTEEEEGVISTINGQNISRNNFNVTLAYIKNNKKFNDYETLYKIVKSLEDKGCVEISENNVEV